MKKFQRIPPAGADLYITGNFNLWDPGDKRFKLRMNNTGKYSISIPERWLKMGFKFTRGSWKTVEVNKFGGFVENRMYKSSASKIYLQIDAWGDK